MVEKTKNPINDFVCKTTFHLNTIKGFHWQTESFQEHNTLDEYHKRIYNLLDKFVETLKEFKPTTDAGYIDIYIDNSDVVQHIREYQEKIKNVRASLNYEKAEVFDKHNDLLSILDDFEQTTNEALFHLRLK